MIRQDGSYRAWISTQFNVLLDGNVTVGDSANPFHIFRTLDNAVKTNDEYNPKVIDIRRRLKSAVSTTLAITDPGRAVNIWHAIDTARVDRFWPEVWVIATSSIDDSRRINGIYPNEFQVDDLGPDEFTTMRFN